MCAVVDSLRRSAANARVADSGATCQLPPARRGSSCSLVQHARMHSAPLQRRRTPFCCACFPGCRGADGETDWDAVIDVEMARRKMLEDSPIPCSEHAPPLHTPRPAPARRLAAGGGRPTAPCRPPPSHDSQHFVHVPLRAANEDPVLFDTAEIPWWAWVRRFHLPEVRGERGGGPGACVHV